MTTEPADVELTRLRILVASMQPVVNAASICEAAWNSDDDEREDCMDEEFALSEALEDYRRELAALKQSRGAT